MSRFEREADYVGAYYAARAGYDLAGAEDLWRALSLENPGQSSHREDHPVTPVRFVQMRKVAAEIADKQRRRLPLIPELNIIETDTEPEYSGREYPLITGGHSPLSDISCAWQSFSSSGNGL